LDIFCFITLISAGRTAYFSGTFWSLIVTSTAITVSLTLLILYLFHAVDLLSQIPWIVSVGQLQNFFAEMIFCFSWAIFYFIVGSVLAIASSSYGHLGFGFAALCAFGAMATYGFDCFLKFLSWKHDELAHGGGPDYHCITDPVRNVERNDNPRKFSDVNIIAR
uniref:MARVEL domain-containing protein n=1 Tax=Enterobius vermicularis TaxID=51028 RepID=A0A0N4V9K9_ENTVE